jgi:hypothetical protein
MVWWLMREQWLGCRDRAAGPGSTRPSSVPVPDCCKQFNERSEGVVNRASLPSGIIAFVVFCRLRYGLTPRDLSEIMPLRGFTELAAHAFDTGD